MSASVKIGQVAAAKLAEPNWDAFNAEMTAAVKDGTAAAVQAAMQTEPIASYMDMNLAMLLTHMLQVLPCEAQREFIEFLGTDAGMGLHEDLDKILTTVFMMGMIHGKRVQ